MNEPILHRRLPVGAEIQPHGGVHYRVWAPRASRVTLVLEGSRHLELPLDPEARGYFSGLDADGAAGDRYRFRLDDDEPLADPASRFQPEGPHGASAVVDPSRFPWTDERWRGVSLRGQVIYEMHVGTFTPEGTWRAAARAAAGAARARRHGARGDARGRVPRPLRLGLRRRRSCIAPTRLYGTPDDFRAFVDRAHALGLGVILDVVYNHLGPDGYCALRRFAEAYFTERYDERVGRRAQLRRRDAAPVREFFVANAALLDRRVPPRRPAARRDAEHPRRLARARPRGDRAAARARPAEGRRSCSSPRTSRRTRDSCGRSSSGGYGLDALWNDDFHHSAVVALTGRREAYYSDYRGAPQEFISAAKYGYLFQGQRYAWQKQAARHAAPSASRPPRFVTFLENHDQVANSGARTRGFTR